MRAVFLIESLELAGAERVVLELAQAGRGEGAEAQVVTLRESETTLHGSHYGNVRRQVLFRRGEFGWPRSALSAAWLLRRALARLRPEVLAIHTPKAAVVAALAGINVPTLWVLHGHDICWDGGSLRRRFSRALQRWTRRRLGGCVAAVSPSLADHAAEGLAMPRESITVIPNGVDLRRFRFHEKIAYDGPTLCVLGRLVPWKGPMQALEAFGRLREKVPSAQLWFVGDGPMRQALEAEVGARGWSRAVTFWGTLPRPEEPLREATVLWLPSESEGLPVACIEAMATGVPVIAFNVRGVHDLLKDGCGVLVSPGDAAKLADETLALLNDPERYRTIARAARARVENEYSLERMCAAHYSLMREISGAGGRPVDGSLSRGFHTRKSPRQEGAGMATLTK